MTRQSTPRTEAARASSAVNDTATVANKTADTGNALADRAVAGVQDASAQVASLTLEAQKSMGESIEDVSERMQGLSSFGQQNFDAFSKASEISAKTLENFSGEVTAYTKKAHEDSIAAIQDLSSVKSVAELVEKQMSFAQHAFDGWMQQATAIGEMYTNAAKEVSAPIEARVAALTEDMKITAR
ncbi:MAG: phasin family protein [Rhodobacteraceae bacterium]|nr:phasin family protein [Paracoccaceae bacterium]